MWSIFFCTLDFLSIYVVLVKSLHISKSFYAMHKNYSVVIDTTMNALCNKNAVGLSFHVGY